MNNNLLKSVFGDISIFIVVCYTFFFLIETVFPGFITLNFDFNWILIPFLFFGLLSIFIDSKQNNNIEKSKINNRDYLFIISLSLIGGLLIFFKTNEGIIIKLLFSLLTAILLFISSLIVFFLSDEEEKLTKDTSTIKIHINNIKSHAYFGKKLLIIGGGLLIIILINLIIFLPKTKKISPRVISQTKISPTPIQYFLPWDVLEEGPYGILPSDEITIRVLNGGNSKNSAEDITKMLKSVGFKKVFYQDADNFQYKNATIRFKAEDKDQALLITELLKNNYDNISNAPLGTDSADIIIILGKKTNETNEIN